MPRINEGRQHRVLFLAKRLEEISGVRDKLMAQLENFERQARVVQREFNALKNLDAPISILPDEMMAMIFEAGTLIDEKKCHFGTLVSHISHHWRHIALTTAQLWTSDISFISPGEMVISKKPYSAKRTERSTCFILRSRKSPIDVSMSNLGGDKVSQHLVQLIGDHIGHCRHLCITTETNPTPLEKAVQYLSPKAIPLLRSLDFTAKFTENKFQFLAPLFPSGTPCLRTAQLGGFDVSTLHFCIPAFRLVTSLRLTGFSIADSDTTAYGSFRDALMALHSLNHLELFPYDFGLMQFRLPIVLPTIHYLHLDATLDPAYLGIIIHSFQAESLITLSLDGWDPAGEDDTLEDALELYFPSLEHLILLNVARDFPDRDLFAQRFPDIKRLTCQSMSPWELDDHAGHESCDIIDIMTPICFGTQFDAATESPPIDDWSRWSKLQVLAVSCTDTAMNTEWLCLMVSTLQDMDHGIRKLLLPKCVCDRVSEDAMGKLRELVEVEDYTLEWPTPFARSS